MWERSAAAAAAIACVVAMGCATSDSLSPNGGPFPKAWVPNVTNDFFPLVPGTIYKYHATTPDGPELDSVEVLRVLKDVNGAAATQVHDQVFVNGELTEDTYDYYAQDTYGNVWYLGKDTQEYDNGQVVSTAGTWHWGVDGAQPGIIMWADPSQHVDNEYRQEFASGQAEDWGKVVNTNQSVTVTAGTFDHCIETEDWSGLEPDVPHEHRFYCPLVGNVLEDSPDEHLELVTLIQTPGLRAASSRP